MHTCFGPILRTSLCWLALGMLAQACGGSSNNNSSSNTSGQGSKSQAGAGGSTTATALGDHVAGKACTSDKDCGSGTCTTEFPGNPLLGQASNIKAPGGYCQHPCNVAADCGAGGLCVGLSQFGLGGQSQCYASCSDSSDCRQGYYCADVFGQTVSSSGAGGSSGTTGGTGSCQVAPATDKLTGSTAGNMCSADGDCGGGRCMTSDLLNMNYPGGYCTGRCLTDADCGDNGLCTTGLPGQAGTCFRKCSSDADCGRDGYRCRATGNGSMECLPGAKPLPDSTTGKACTSDSDCGGAAMSCMTKSMGFMSTTYPDGYCTQSCVDNSDCGAGGVCPFGGLGSFAVSMCYKPCSSQSDCRTGYTCQMLTTGRGTGMNAQQIMVCAPPPPMRTTGEDAGI